MENRSHTYFSELFYGNVIQTQNFERYHEIPQKLYSSSTDQFNCDFWFFSVLSEKEYMYILKNGIDSEIADYCYKDLNQTKVNIFSHFYPIAVHDFLLYLKTDDICTSIALHVSASIYVEIYDGKFIFCVSFDDTYVEIKYVMNANEFQIPREKFRSDLRMLSIMPNKITHEVSNEFKLILNSHPCDDESSIFGLDYRISKGQFNSKCLSSKS
jgi:hypothetical protein